uniref:Valyl-tRNA synthetase n=1 Tax=Pseudomonas phage RVTF4 TaxID=3236931 RepID=A0AB39CDB7_9VIRU
MQCLTHVLRPLLFIAALAVTGNAIAKDVVVDELFCDSLALMSKAGAEAKQRGESEAKWRSNLIALRGYVVKNKDNVLYSILPKVQEEVSTVYSARRTPIDTYIASYNNCMGNEYGNVVTLNY